MLISYETCKMAVLFAWTCQKVTKVSCSSRYHGQAEVQTFGGVHTWAIPHPLVTDTLFVLEVLAV